MFDVFYWVDVPACKNVCSRASLLARWPVGFTQSLSVIDDAVFYSVYVCRRRCPWSVIDAMRITRGRAITVTTPWKMFQRSTRAVREGSAVGITDEQRRPRKSPWWPYHQSESSGEGQIATPLRVTSVQTGTFASFFCILGQP